MRFHDLVTQAIMPVTAIAALGAMAHAQPATIDLTGVVRDFRASHPDFDVSAAPGHYAGNVDLTPNAVTGAPEYTGGGYEVTTQWTDVDGRNIAPHLFGVALGSCKGMPSAAHGNSVIQIGNQSQVYGYEYGVTPPGGVPALITTNATASGECEVIGNSDLWGDLLVGVGADPFDVCVLTPNGYIDGTLGNLSSPIPPTVLSPPAGMPPSVGDRTYSAGVSQITTDMHFNNLTLSGDARVEVPTGFNVRILVDGAFLHTANGSPTAGLYVEPGASLDIWFMSDDVDVNGGVMEATNEDPSLLRIYMPQPGGSTNDFDLAGNGSRVRAMMWAPDADLEMTQNSEFWGTFVGREIDLENKCKLYINMAAVGGTVSDTAGAAGPAGGSITSAASFSDWFTNVLGENFGKSHTITLVRDGFGVYEYFNDDFHPIDGELFGNEGEPNNNNFTYSISASFVYQGCADQFVAFRGADDMWLFINGELVMDLGGVQSTVPQYLELDRLGLTAGQTYELNLFYAQRNSTLSMFRLRTDLVLSTINLPIGVSAVFD